MMPKIWAGNLFLKWDWGLESDVNFEFKNYVKSPKFAILLLRKVGVDNAGSCKESRDLKKINKDTKKGTTIWTLAKLDLETYQKW